MKTVILAGRAIDVFLNMSCFQEMTEKQVNTYFRPRKQR